MFSDAGELLHIERLIGDITDQKLAEDYLRQNGEQLRSVVNNVIEGIITIDEEARIQSFNKSAQDILGYGEDEEVGRNVKLLMPERQPPGTRPLCGQLSNHGRAEDHRHWAEDHRHWAGGHRSAEKWRGFSRRFDRMRILGERQAVFYRHYLRHHRPQAPTGIVDPGNWTTG